MNFVKEMKVGNVMLSWGANRVVGKGLGEWVGNEGKGDAWMTVSSTETVNIRRKGSLRGDDVERSVGDPWEYAQKRTKKTGVSASATLHCKHTHAQRHTCMWHVNTHPMGSVHTEVGTCRTWGSKQQQCENEAPEASWGFRSKIDASLFIKDHRRGGRSGVLPPVQQRQSMVFFFLTALIFQHFIIFFFIWLWFYSAHVLSCSGW